MHHRQVGKLSPVFPSPIKIEMILWKYHLNNIITQGFETDVLMKPPIVKKCVLHWEINAYRVCMDIFFPSSVLSFLKSQTIHTDTKSFNYREPEEYKESTTEPRQD